MTTPTPPTYYNDYEAGGFRTPNTRQPRVLDIYLQGPRGCGYIYTPAFYRDARLGTTLSLMISAQTGIDISKTGSTGIMVAYKLVADDGTQLQAGTQLLNSSSIGLTTDNTRGISLAVGGAIAVGVSFGSGITNNTAYTFYIVNQTSGNSGELIWRMQYIVNPALTGWFQYGVNQNNWPPLANSNTDGLSPTLAYSYGSATGYTGSVYGSASSRPYKLNEIKT